MDDTLSFNDSERLKQREFLLKTIKAAGEIALEEFNRVESLRVRHKSLKDIVTEADWKVEEFIKKQCQDQFPTFSFLGEETGTTPGKKGQWIVDPIDGTHSFTRNQVFWSISIALQIDGEIVLGAVLAPALNELYFAEKGKGAVKNSIPIEISQVSELDLAMVGTGFACLRANLADNNLTRFSRIALKTMGQRRFGSAALDLCMVACGQLDAFWEQHLNIYDVAAGIIIVQEAGGTITDFQGKKVVDPKNILATNGKLLPALLPLM